MPSKTLKPCSEGKVRNTVTNRCVNAEKPKKKTSKLSPKPCPDGKVRNPTTKKCVKSKVATPNDLALASDIQKDYLKQRAQLGKLEAKLEDCKNRHVELMHTMAKCHEDLKELKRKSR